MQRALNALARDAGRARLRVDGRMGRRTFAALAGFLAARGAAGEARLLRAMRALGGSVHRNLPATLRNLCNLWSVK
ncbi:MAG TPA: putative peptidoglycan-binding domain-containing protein [Allosphingosinicella sp.]|nr:putative peptidoglycan-binding domain-containing protein [Allosphingosinicella sp.]